MSNPQFTFGTPATSGASSGSPFGSSNTTFGSTTPATQAGSNLNFGPPASSTNAKPWLFGTNSATSQPAGQTSSLFGQGATSGSTPFSFGGQNPTTSSGQSTPTLFGATSQATNKTSATATPGQTATSGTFLGNTGKTGGLFGGTTSTPAPSGGTSLFNAVSTTPAGPPPQGNGATQGQSLFSQTTQKPAGGLFGPVTTTSSGTPSTAATAVSQPQVATSLFGGATSGQAGMGLFGAQGVSAAGSIASPAPNVQASAAPSAPILSPQKSIFGNLGAITSPGAPLSTSAAAPSSAGLGTPKSTATIAPAITASTFTGGLFGKPVVSVPSTQPSTTSVGTAAPSTAAEKPSTTTTAHSTSTPVAGVTASATTSAAGGAALGASTAGPTPPAQSRLKNKTMDEIITRWATDLSKYQKDFREQAEKVAEWDRMLVENITNVQKLYGNTVDADRATQEIERQLVSVENQQEELSSWLDRYEREIDEIMSKQVGLGETLQGPDQERERTYKMAERLSERLDEMGKDLTSIIEEVNGASATLSKTNKADEPISQIVRILNSHLSQLQLIDRGTAELQAKVSAAQKAGHGLSSRLDYRGGAGLGTSSVVDDFYRSYMGRR